MNDPDISSRPDRRHRWFWLLLWLLGILTIALAAAVLSRWESVRPLKSSEAEMSLYSVTLLKPSIAAVVEWIAWPGCSILLAGGGIVGLCWSRCFLGAMNLIASVLVIPAIWIVGFTTNVAPYCVTSELTGPDGRKYAFLDSEFLQGQTLALGIQTRRGLFTVCYDEVGATNGDSPRSWASVIRPAGAPEGYGQLYMNKAGLIVAIRYDFQAYFAFDTKSGRFFGHGAVEDLSPFVLIDEGVQMNPRDVESILTGKGAEDAMGVPPMKYLQEATHSPRADIRGVANQMIVRRRAATSENP